LGDPVRVKICGLTRREDVVEADRLGADYVGVVVTEGFGRSVSPEVAGSLVEGAAATPVAVLVDETVEEAARLARSVGARVVQLHGDETPRMARALAEEGEWQIWKAVRARDPRDVLMAVERYGDFAAAILVEGWRDGVSGGGGARLDMHRFADVLRKLPDRIQLVLAGGLTADWVEEAVEQCQPDVVDVSSGVEILRGRKSPELMRRFIASARRASNRARVSAPSDTGKADS
jgi:phosphoribosylanthranilate isomerase